MSFFGLVKLRTIHLVPQIDNNMDVGKKDEKVVCYASVSAVKAVF